MAQLLKQKSSVIYDEQLHKYTIEGVELKAVTSYIKERFIRPFEPLNAAIGVYTAHKNKNEFGLRPEKQVRYWNLNAKRSANRGTAIHNFAEMYDMDSSTFPVDNYEKAVIKCIQEIKDKGYELIGNEIQVYSKAHKLAGTIDRLLRNKATGKYVIMDWKTSFDIDKCRYKMLNEFKDYKDAKRVQYEIQLLIYKELIQYSIMQDIPLIKKEDIEDLWIVLLDNNCDYSIECVRNEIDVPVQIALNNICDYNELINQRI